MTDVFKAARERVSAEEAARRYGLTFDRKNWALCPFHDDSTPSMSFRAGRFRCWACNEGGDSIDFTAKFFGLSKMDAVRRLNDDFMLGLPIGRPMTTTDRQQAERRRDLMETERAFNEWRMQLANRLDRCCRVANQALARGMDDFTESEVLAIRSVSALEYWSDTLSRGTTADIMDIFRDRRGIEDLCDKILRNSQKNSKTA